MAYRRLSGITRDMTVIKDPWHYPRPRLATALLETLRLGLTSARGLFASRRMGKTEFLLQDLVPAAHGAGMLTAYANLWDNRADPATALVGAVARAVKPKGLKKLWQDLQQPLKGVKASGTLPGLGGASVEVSLADVGEPEEVLTRVLREFDRSGKALLLLIDEAQVLAQPQNTHFAHALRAALDTRKQSIKVVFAGSSEATLRQMFALRTEPFYNWAPLEPFELLGRPFVYALVEKVNAITKLPLGAKDALAAFEELGQTPEFFRRYLDRYLTYPMQGSAAALAHTKAHVFSGTSFQQMWDALQPVDREVLRLAADGVKDLHGLDARKRLGKVLGRKQEVLPSLP